MTDLEIYTLLLGNFPINTSIWHPMPEKRGNSPALKVYVSDVIGKDNKPRIFWYDYRNTEGGGPIQLASMVLGKDIHSVLSILKTYEGKVSVPNIDYVGAADPEVFLYPELQPDAIAYYERNGISKDMLEHERVFSVRKAVFSPKSVWYHKEGEPLLYWKIGDGIKIYNPLTDNRYRKWRSFNQPKDSVDGLHNIVHVPILYVASSRKDRMLQQQVMPTINPHGSETSMNVWEVCIAEILSKCDHLVFTYDGDDAGTDGAMKAVCSLNLPNVHYLDTRLIYEQHKPYKDPCDLCWHKGKDVAISLLQHIKSITEQKLIQ